MFSQLAKGKGRGCSSGSEEEKRGKKRVLHSFFFPAFSFLEDLSGEDALL